jgi:hypothetical protein
MPRRKEFVDTTPVPIEELDELLPQIRLMKAWIAAVEKRLEAELISGKRLKNAQLVLTQTHRKWKDGEEGLIVALLMDHGLSADTVAPKTLISVAQAEQAYGNGFLDLMRDMIEKPKGKPTMAAMNDTRLPYIVPQSPTDAFKEKA